MVHVALCTQGEEKHGSRSVAQFTPPKPSTQLHLYALARGFVSRLAHTTACVRFISVLETLTREVFDFLVQCPDSVHRALFRQGELAHSLLSIVQF